MFESIRVRNFRSVEDSGLLRLADLNIIVGPNNSGKSSCLLYPILMIKNTLEDTDETNTLVTTRPNLDLGSYLDLIHTHDPKRPLGLDFALSPEVLSKSRYRLSLGQEEASELAFSNPISFCTEFIYDRSTNQVKVQQFENRDKHGAVDFGGTRDSGKWEIEIRPSWMQPYVGPDFSHFIAYPQWSGEPPKDMELVHKIISGLMLHSGSSSEVAEAMHLVKYVAPVRVPIPRFTRIGTMPSSELGPAGENLMRILSEDKATGAGLIGKLSYWLAARFRLMRDVQLIFRDADRTFVSLMAKPPRRDLPQVNLADMGTGVSQLVPVIVQTILLPENGCLLVEQPEIHLHPRAQADLADLFIDGLSQRRQFIIETHSEHLVLRVRRRIAEGKLDHSRVRIFFVQLRAGKTRVRQLRLDEHGHFPKWPKNFFEEGFEEAMAIAEAQIR